MEEKNEIERTKKRTHFCWEEGMLLSFGEGCWICKNDLVDVTSNFHNKS